MPIVISQASSFRSRDDGNDITKTPSWNMFCEHTALNKGTSSGHNRLELDVVCNVTDT